MSNIQYIDTVTISHSSDAGESWYSDSSSTWSSSEIPVNFIFNIPDTDTISFYNKFKIEVLDIGDYGGVNKQLHSDITDHLITITSNELQNDYSTGWNIISTPLDLEDTNVWSNFNGENDDMGMYFLYNQDEQVCGFPQCDDSDLIFEIEEGYYMLTDAAAVLGLQGTVLIDQSIIELQQGWNLIGNPLVTKVIVDNLEFQWSDNQNPDDIFTFEDAVENKFIMPTIQGFNNQTKMHEPVSILEPFYGYWIHADTTGLNLIVEPHIYDESLYSNDRDEHWELILHAQEHEPNSSLENYIWRDMIKIGLSSTAEDGMVYGEDEYDIPVIVNPASYTNMYIDQPEWEEAGAETRRFYSDIRVLESADVTKTWNLTGQLLGSVLSDSIFLFWDIGNLELLGEHEINFVVGEEIVDMRENSSLLIVKEFFENMQITVGPLFDDTCESQGLVTCFDGSCAATIEDCSCESQGLVTCNDGDCAEDLEDCIDLSNEIPENFSITRPYPNPFNPTVKFDFSLPSLEKVSINVYDINGMHVATLMNEIKPAGYYSVVWVASSEPTGMYFIQFSSKDVIETMKVVLIK
jgi:hypothetical protein